MTLADSIGSSAAAGFYRLAQALIEMDELAEAASAIEDGLRVDPGGCGAAGTAKYSSFPLWQAVAGIKVCCSATPFTVA